ncbi:MAG TPA: hypothetical protein PLL30_17215 [Candidatus Krumholzibacteria bacterium]|nr:hypothetical protein [Candidatus Krumholzibacteria bacterium]HPD73516.1 hypothetical protein [Candidatus Krumholzibacteria bacterium]HRY42238.1 hypothetical protein [Candidatus Krumholzibacteria bacterium]
MAKSVRQKIYEAAITRLESILLTGGYNTQPRICAGQDEAWNALESVAVWATWGPEEFSLEDRSLGGGQTCVCSLQVSAYIRRDAGDLVALAEQALQDIRNAMESSYTTWQSGCDATLRGLDTCETDEGVLAFDGRALFTQPFIFEYRAGPTW